MSLGGILWEKVKQYSSNKKIEQIPEMSDIQKQREEDINKMTDKIKRMLDTDTEYFKNLASTGVTNTNIYHIFEEGNLRNYDDECSILKAASEKLQNYQD